MQTKRKLDTELLVKSKRLKLDMVPVVMCRDVLKLVFNTPQKKEGAVEEVNPRVMELREDLESINENLERPFDHLDNILGIGG